MSYIDIVIRTRPLPILETWPPIYRGQERTVRDRLRVNQSLSYVYFWYAPCLTDFTFEFIRRPIPLILSPSYWTFVELTLVRQIESKPKFTLHLLSIRTLFDWFYLRVHLTPYSPDPKSFILDICRVNPRQRASNRLSYIDWMVVREIEIKREKKENVQRNYGLPRTFRMAKWTKRSCYPSPNDMKLGKD
jgi:hypothetical protein